MVSLGPNCSEHNMVLKRQIQLEIRKVYEVKNKYYYHLKTRVLKLSYVWQIFVLKPHLKAPIIQHYNMVHFDLGVALTRNLLEV